MSLLILSLLEKGNMYGYQKVLVGKRMTRVYYHLEEAGRARLRELIQEYQDVTQGVFQIIQRGKEKDGNN